MAEGTGIEPVCAKAQPPVSGRAQCLSANLPQKMVRALGFEPRCARSERAGYASSPTLVWWRWKESNLLGRDNWFTASRSAVLHYIAEMVRSIGVEPTLASASGLCLCRIGLRTHGGPRRIRTCTEPLLRRWSLPVGLAARNVFSCVAESEGVEPPAGISGDSFQDYFP